MQDALQSWATERWGDTVTVQDVQDLGGHSGQTIGFTVIGPGVEERLVIRLAPKGVAHRGSTDVLRQAPLLRALHAEDVAVPALCDASGDIRFFGVPYLVMERLPGRPLIMGPDAGPSWLPARDRQRAHDLAVEQLALIHAVDAARSLACWEPPRSLQTELEFWADILQRSPEEHWLRTGTELKTELSDRRPARWRVGVCHGDFQTNNVLYTGEGQDLKVTGVVDWEIASIGATELDLAWFLMMNDTAAWDPVEQRGGLDLERLLGCYERAAKRPIDHLEWFWAMACFRMIAIAAINIRMHRSGRRPDEAWERASTSVPFMFERAFALLEKAEDV